MRPTSTPSPTPRKSDGAVVVTDADSGSTVRLHTGEHLEVRLSPRGGSWHQPQSNDSDVLFRTKAYGGYPDSTTAVGEFIAQQVGRTTVTSETDYQCLHTTPRCLPPQALFTITVVVSG